MEKFTYNSKTAEVPSCLDEVSSEQYRQFSYIVGTDEPRYDQPRTVPRKMAFFPSGHESGLHHVPA